MKSRVSTTGASHLQQFLFGMAFDHSNTGDIGTCAESEDGLDEFVLFTLSNDHAGNLNDRIVLRLGENTLMREAARSFILSGSTTKPFRPAHSIS